VLGSLARQAPETLTHIQRLIATDPDPGIRQSEQTIKISEPTGSQSIYVSLQAQRSSCGAQPQLGSALEGAVPAPSKAARCVVGR
jgi:hypothetical protein